MTASRASAAAMEAALTLGLSCADCILTVNDDNDECDKCDQFLINTAIALDAFADKAVQAALDMSIKNVVGSDVPAPSTDPSASCVAAKNGISATHASLISASMCVTYSTTRRKTTK